MWHQRAAPPSFPERAPGAANLQPGVVQGGHVRPLRHRLCLLRHQHVVGRPDDLRGLAVLGRKHGGRQLAAKADPEDGELAAGAAGRGCSKGGRFRCLGRVLDHLPVGGLHGVPDVANLQRLRELNKGFFCDFGLFDEPVGSFFARQVFHNRYLPSFGYVFSLRAGQGRLVGQRARC